MLRPSSSGLASSRGSSPTCTLPACRRAGKPTPRVRAGPRGRSGHAERLDVLVNNAAVLHLATIDATTTAAFESVLRVNALGPFLGTRACLPLLRASGRGSIVNLGSIDSVAGAPLTAAYTASKFALRGLTKVTALENRRFGVRANVVCPEAGNPEMHPPVVGWEHVAATPRPAPPGRGPAAVAPAAVFFASEESALCNGTELVLDAGRMAGQYFDLPDELYAARVAPD